MIKLVYVERGLDQTGSLERVFRQIAHDLPKSFEPSFAAVPYGNGIAAIIKNLLFFKRPAADLYHLTGDVTYIALRLPPEKTVMTIPDLVFLRQRSGLRRFILKKLFLDWPLRRTRHVTAISAATRNEILMHADILPERVIVLDLPLISGFKPDAARVFNEKSPVILHIGTARNKNLVNLIRALRGIECILRIIGPLDGKVKQLLRESEVRFENVFELDDRAIIDEFRNADLVAFCSTYEGFGLPLIEAQAMGTPVVTSHLPPMNYVAGDGAVYVDPNDIDSIRNGILKIIHEPELRQTIIDAGFRNITRFESKTIAGAYADLYDRVLGN